MQSRIKTRINNFLEASILDQFIELVQLIAENKPENQVLIGKLVKEALKCSTREDALFTLFQHILEKEEALNAIRMINLFIADNTFEIIKLRKKGIRVWEECLNHLPRLEAKFESSLEKLPRKQRMVAKMEFLLGIQLARMLAIYDFDQFRNFIKVEGDVSFEEVLKNREELIKATIRDEKAARTYLRDFLKYWEDYYFLRTKEDFTQLLQNIHKEDRSPLFVRSLEFLGNAFSEHIPMMKEYLDISANSFAHFEERSAEEKGSVTLLIKQMNRFTKQCKDFSKFFEGELARDVVRQLDVTCLEASLKKASAHIPISSSTEIENTKVSAPLPTVEKITPIKPEEVKAEVEAIMKSFSLSEDSPKEIHPKKESKKKKKKKNKNKSQPVTANKDGKDEEKPSDKPGVISEFDLRLERARYLLTQGSLQEGIADVEKLIPNVLDHVEHLIECYVFLGDAHSASSQHLKAKEYYTKVLSLIESLPQFESLADFLKKKLSPQPKIPKTEHEPEGFLPNLKPKAIKPKPPVKTAFEEEALKPISIKKHIALPEEIQVIINHFHKNGVSVKVVGGFVRDALMNKTSHDIDLVCDAPLSKIDALLKELPPQYHAILAGKDSPHALLDKLKYDVQISPLKCREKGDGEEETITLTNGHPVRYRYCPDINKDVLLRDITINGFYYDPINHEVIDPLGLAFKDLKAKLIRGIYLKDHGYIDNAIFMLRNIRFAGRFNFKIDPETEAYIQKEANHMVNIDQTRLIQQIKRILLDGAALRTFTLLSKFNVFQQLFPCAAPYLHGGINYPPLQKVLQEIKEKPSEKCLGAFFATLLWEALDLPVDLSTQSFLTKEIIKGKMDELLVQQSKTLKLDFDTIQDVKRIWAERLKINPDFVLDPKLKIPGNQFYFVPQPTPALSGEMLEEMLKLEQKRFGP